MNNFIKLLIALSAILFQISIIKCDDSMLRPTVIEVGYYENNMTLEHYYQNTAKINNLRNLIKFQFNYLFRSLLQSDNPKPMPLTHDMIEILKKIRVNYKKLNVLFDFYILNDDDLNNIKLYENLTKNSIIKR